MSPTPTDAQLVERCRAGDQASWALLIERYGRYVRAIAVRGYGLQDADAQDVFQEVFVRTHRHLGRLRDPGALKPWLAQLTRRIAVDQLRAAGRAGPGEAADDQAAGEDVFATLDEALAVQAAVAMLPEHCGEVLDRFFARDESYATIGEALGIPAGTIASRISRCLARLRAELKDDR